jgi:hypothetical protein
MGFDPSGGGSVAVGTDAMRNEVGGNGTVSIGQNAGRNGTAYNGNVFIGTNAGQGLDFGGGSSCATGCANPVGVTAIGYNAFSAQSNTTAQNAVVVGNSAGSSLTGGAGFVLVGTNAGLTAAGPVDATTVGNAAGVSSNGVVIGSKAGIGAPTGIGGGNVLVGYQNAQNITSGHDNLILGTQVAPTLTTGAANTIIGHATATDVPNASMSFMLNIENMIYLNIATKAAPALSACGTSPVIDAHANNRSGTITAGSGALASCTMTFAGTGYASWNHCRVTSQAAVASFTYSYTLTTLTVAGTSITSDKFDYDCDGY